MTCPAGPQPPDPQTWLKGRDPKAFNRALHIVGAMEFYAREMEGWSLDDVLPHLTPDEAAELRRHIGRIDAVHSQVARRIRAMTSAVQTRLAQQGDPFMPYPENAPTPDDLPDLGKEEIADLPPELLAILQRETDDRLKRAKAAKAQLDGALALRYADRAAEARKSAGKDTGTVRLTDGDLTVVADLPKRVEWDQDQLAEMVARIRAAGDDPAHYVDIGYKVPERKYTAWPAPIRDGFEPARTVRTGSQAFRILEDEPAASTGSAQ